MLSEVLPYYSAAFDVDLVLLENKVSFNIPDSVNVICLDRSIDSGNVISKAVSAVSTIFRLRRRLRETKYAAIVSYLDSYNVMVCVANSLRRGKTKHIACEQTLDYEFFQNSAMAGWKQRIFKIAVKIAYNKVDRIIAVSQNLKNFLEFELGVKTPITVIHNGVDTGKFNLDPPADTGDIDSKFKNTKTKLLCLSRLDHQKNIFFLLDSFALAADTAGDANLFILGSGPLQAAIGDRIALLNLKDRVYLLGFSNHPEDYLKLCDAFLLTSRYESFGNVVIEALACGAPVLTTNYGKVIYEIIQSKDLGHIIDQHDKRGYADAIIDLVNNNDRYDKANLFKYAASKFDASVKAKEYVETVNAEIAN